MNVKYFLNIIKFNCCVISDKVRSKYAFLGVFFAKRQATIHSSIRLEVSSTSIDCKYTVIFKVTT